MEGKIVIDVSRDGYSTDQIKRTATVGELISCLEDLDPETPIFFGFDNRYTYGALSINDVDFVE